jgi:hypothetical protein
MGYVETTPPILDPDIDPGMGGLAGTCLTTDVTADISGRDTKASAASQHDMGMILADAGPFSPCVCGRGIDLCDPWRID